MPERPQPTPQEAMPAPEPRLRKVYDRDEDERKARLKEATGGLKDVIKARSNEADKLRTRQAVRGLKEAIQRNDPAAVEARKAQDREEGIDPGSLAGGVTKQEEEWFEAGERGEAGDIVKPEQTEAVEGATMNAAQQLIAVENRIEEKFGIDLSALKIDKGVIKKARVEDPALFAAYDDARAEYDAWLEQGKQAGAFTGRSTAAERLSVEDIAAGERGALTLKAKVDRAKGKPEEEIELEIDDADIDDSDDEEEVAPVKPAFTPKEQEWFAEGEKGHAGDVAMSSREHDETIVKALQDAAERLTDTTRGIKRTMKDPDFDFEPNGWWGKRRLRKAREKYSDFFKRYDDEKREYDALLVQADRYGVFSGKVGTPRLGMMEKAKQQLGADKIMGRG